MYQEGESLHPLPLHSAGQSDVRAGHPAGGGHQLVQLPPQHQGKLLSSDVQSRRARTLN